MKQKIITIILSLALMITMGAIPAYGDEYIVPIADGQNAVDMEITDGAEESIYQPEKYKAAEGTYLANYSNKSGSTIPLGAKNIIIAFFDAMYESSMYLEGRDVIDLFSPDYYGNARMIQTAMDVVNESRLRQANDMRLTYVEYDCKVTAVKKFSSKRYRVTTSDSSRMNFAYLEGITTEVINVSTVFVVVKKDGQWKIKSINRNMSPFSVVRGKYLKLETEGMSNEELDIAIRGIYDNLMVKYDEMDAKNAELLEKSRGKMFKAKECDHKYDRKAAVEFAQSHVKTRTKVDYSGWGGNCQNYASNMLLAGGIPMDYKGKQQWKHYSMKTNYENRKVGRTSSFIVVGSFYTYAKNNTGYGLVAKCTSNPYYAQPGDVLQVGSNGAFGHTIVAVNRIEKDEKLVDILVNSNTLDLINYPLSAYAYADRRLINICGWND